MSFFTWFRHTAVVLAITAFCGQAFAVETLITGWNFQTSTPPDLNNAQLSPIAASNLGVNAGSASGFHASAATDWSTPGGNGSTESFSSNTWAVNDQWLFHTSTTGFSDIGVRLEQTSSATGPRDFDLQYSTDGINFTTFASYDSKNNGLTPNWNQNAPILEDLQEFDLSSISALDNQANAYIRLLLTSNVAVRGDTIQAGGTNRIDNVRIFGGFVPTPPATPQLPANGDLVLGLGFGRPDLTVELVRGPRTANGGAEVPSPWTEQGFLHSVEFDNKDGTLHNAKGNLLGVDEGSRTVAGVITTGTVYSLPTLGTPPLTPNQPIATTGGASGVTLSRLSGISVAPDNLKIAVAALDTGKVAVYDYTAGNSMGSGASTSGGRQTAGTILTPTVPDDNGSDPNTTITYRYGTAWLDENTVLSMDRDGELYSVDATSMATTLETTVSVPGIGGEYMALAYNPDVSPYLYAMYSGFNTGSDPPTRNRLYVLDPEDDYSLLSLTDLSTMDTLGNTAREMALDADGNLLIGSFGSQVFLIEDVVTDPTTIADPVSFYDSTNSSGFVGLDVGFSEGLDGDHNGDGVVDAADYVAGRKLPSMFGGDPAWYNTYVENFGEGGTGGGGSGAVPEPASLSMLALGLAALCFRRRGA